MQFIQAVTSCQLPKSTTLINLVSTHELAYSFELVNVGRLRTQLNRFSLHSNEHEGNIHLSSDMP